MMNTTWKLRLSEEELGRWKRAAAVRGQLLSEWVRENCEAGADADLEEGHHKLPDVSRTAKVREDGGRESVSVESVPGIPKPIDKCMCGDTYEQHYHGHSCQAKLCQCRIFELDK